MQKRLRFRFGLSVLSIFCLLGCGQSLKFQSNSSSSVSARQTATRLGGNGPGGYDGKVYRHFGACGAAAGVTAALQLGFDSGGTLRTASVTRENCQDVTPARPIDPAAVSVLAKQTIAVYKSEIYDSADQNRLSAVICASNNGTQVSVWSPLSDLTLFYASVTYIGGGNSGDFAVGTPLPTAEGAEFISNPKSFTLRANFRGGFSSLVFDTGAGQLNVSDLNCAAGPALSPALAPGPPPPPLEPGGVIIDIPAADLHDPNVLNLIPQLDSALPEAGRSQDYQGLGGG